MRDAAINIIIKELSQPTPTSVLSARLVPTNEAEVISRQVEQEAVTAAEAAGGGGKEMLEAYIDVISNLMGKIVVKARSENVTSTTMTAAGKQKPPSSIEEITEKISIWPQSQIMRDTVINRIIKELSWPTVTSVLGRQLPTNEAEVIAREVEHEAVTSAEAASGGGIMEMRKAYVDVLGEQLFLRLRSHLSDNGASATDDGENRGLCM